MQKVLVSIANFACEEADEIAPMFNKNGEQIGEISITFRPYLFEFLDDISSRFELVLYTSYSTEYMEAIVKVLEKRKKYFAYKFGEDFCIIANISSYSVKCVNFLLGNRSENDIIMVDNDVKEFPFSTDNFVPVSYYEGNKAEDDELPKLASFLKKLSEEKNVREVIKHYRNLS